MSWRQGSRRQLAQVLMRQSQVDENGCLVWSGPRRNGRGFLNVYGAFWDVQRLAWSLANDLRIGDRLIGAACGQGLCIHPNHLRNITPAKCRPWEERSLPRRATL